MNAPHRHAQPRETDPAAIDAALQQAMASTVIAEVHARRCEQITLHGHTPAIDAARPLGMMIRKVQDFASSANDHCGHGAQASPDNLRNGRKHLVTAAALLIATIDRIDAELAAAGGEG